MKCHIREHMSFIEVGFWLDLDLEITHRYKELVKVLFGLGNEILFVTCSVGDVHDLQEPCVKETLRRAREVEDSKIECWLQRESHVQPALIGPNFYFDLTEP